MLLRPEIDLLSRTPFRRLLSKVLEAEPTKEALEAYASKYPDKWGQLIAIVARLSGYGDRLEIEAHLSIDVVHLSDADLERRLKAVDEKLTAIGLASLRAHKAPLTQVCLPQKTVSGD